MDLLTLLLLPLGVFAFNPVLCGILAGAFTIPVFLPVYATRSRLALALAALAWWACCWREATVAADAVRTDFADSSPFLLATAVFGAWHLARGLQRPEPPPPINRRLRRLPPARR